MIAVTRRSLDIGRALLVPVCLIAMAQVAAMAMGMKSYTLAAPTQIIVDGAQALVDGTIPIATAQTLVSVLTGFVLGGLGGVFLGLVFGLYRRIDLVTEFPVEVIRAMPSIALLPVWMIVYGLGYKMEIAVIAFTTVWPNMLLTRAAVRGVSPRLLEVSRILRLSPADTMQKIVLPAILPSIFVSLRLALGFSLIIGITIEIVGNPQGLGAAIMIARESMNPGLMLALIVWVGLIGFTLNGMMTLGHRRLFGARPVRGQGA